MRKLKLMKAIRQLDADIVILDLGGDTSFNIIDFFLSADVGLVTTTCDPAAYLDAYGFLKVALYRRLSRLFGPESGYRKFYRPELKELLQDFMAADPTAGSQRIDQLVQAVRNELPAALPLVVRVLREFQPCLLVNMARSDAEARQLVKRLGAVARKMLSLDLTCLPPVAFEAPLQRSARELVPAVARHPDGSAAAALARVADALRLGVPGRLPHRAAV
jgi:flagellar biosynthesis protein FlhG